MLKMFKINVAAFYVKADKNDPEDLKERVFTVLQELMESDELEYRVSEVDEEAEDEFFDDDDNSDNEF
jgi:hypothetical protein